jgi:hypothetical protein
MLYKIAAAALDAELDGLGLNPGAASILAGQEQDYSF